MPDQQAEVGLEFPTRGEVRVLGPVQLVGPDGPVTLPDELSLLLGLLALRAGEPVPGAELVAAAQTDYDGVGDVRSLDEQAGLLVAALEDCGLPDALEIRPTGYLLRLPGRRIDAHRFTRLLARARQRMAAGELASATRLFTAALAAWSRPTIGGADDPAGTLRVAGDPPGTLRVAGDPAGRPEASLTLVAESGRGPVCAAGAGDPLSGCRLRPSGWAAAAAGRLTQARVAAIEDRWECALRLAATAHAAAGGPVADRSVVAAGIAAGRLAGEAVAELTAAVARHPLRARLWELLLVASFLSTGRRAAAEVERRARETFLEQLGVEPAGRLRALAEAVRRGDLADDWALADDWTTDPGRGPVPGGGSGGPVPGPRPAVRAPLPVPLTALLGRDELLGGIRQRLATHRLVTLTGPGGAGKTRLAVAAARRVAEVPAWFVDLSALESPVRVPEAVATALGVREEAGRDLVETLATDLGTVRALLVLDNCEHLVAGCAELIGWLLPRCPGLRVLATSRVALRVPGEARIPVPPLAIPAADTGHSLAALAGHPATRLFLDRAREFSGRPVPEASADAVVQVCAELDGLPLAIELAAARTPVLSVNEIVARLRADLRLLRSPDPTAPSRHRSLAAVVESSVTQLDHDARRLFERLAVCTGGFDAEVAQAIGGPTAPAALAALVDASLVETVPADGAPVGAIGAVTVPADGAPVGTVPAGGTRPYPSAGGTRPSQSAGGTRPYPPAGGRAGSAGASAARRAGAGRTRYRMLVPIRRHALTRLIAGGGEVAARQALATYCLGLAQRADARLRGAAQEWWLGRLRAEAANLRAAMAWLAEAGAGGPAHGDLRLAAGLAMYCRLEGHYREGHGWLAGALTRHPDAPAALRARAGTGAAMLAMLLCDYPAATEHAELAQVACRSTGDRRAEARVEQILGSVARERARYAESASHLAAAGAIFAECGDEWGEAQIAELRGFTAWLSGDLDRADSRLRASLRRHQRLGDVQAEASALMNLGAVALYRGDVDRASSLLDVALQRYSAIGFPEGVGWAHNLRGLVELRAGRTERAAAHLMVSLAAHRQVGDRWRAASVLEALAEVARLDGEPVRGARLLGAAARIRDEIGAPVPACERPDTETTRQGLRAELGDHGFTTAYLQGRGSGLDSLLLAGPDQDRTVRQPA